MHIALIGTRGVPAHYGGFETAVEEVGRRLVARGHRVTVYCRDDGTGERPRTYLGMELVHLPAVRQRSLETLSHTALSVVHQVVRARADVAVVFNAANSIFLPLLRIGRTPAATHVDGLEWRRGKWGPTGQRYYRMAESLSVRWSDALIADAAGIADYYVDEFGAMTHQIAYGAPILDHSGASGVEGLGLTSHGYHLVVARFEPENHVDVALEGYLASAARLPLVVVGSAPYRSAHVERLERLAASDPRVRLLGGVWDQDLLDQLYANAATYVHGHSVGGTNPSLLRAMGAAAYTVAYDVMFNREVLGRTGRFFGGAADLAVLLEASERRPEEMRRLGEDARRRAADRYTWDDVAARYEKLCSELAEGLSERRRRSGRRSGGSRRLRDERPAEDLVASGGEAVQRGA
ncbi:DUF1972 domain-containing protein [Luteipulveratus flavus]|uniref:DUF1972 domain-containing protein n=1 Tax=Luteipulveratus flavus TaxID=3031728 RepID=A0ABT6CEI9_9MICO|nr:DUF1972 domain-containing protein [Luteipulveratus sp. YIM 133296]MDF8266454.1 DUF1972 domain-containing protein [Luteipulveratus sp. YIM 133296]